MTEGTRGLIITWIVTFYSCEDYCIVSGLPPFLRQDQERSADGALAINFAMELDTTVTYPQASSKSNLAKKPEQTPSSAVHLISCDNKN